MRKNVLLLIAILLCSYAKVCAQNEPFSNKRVVNTSPLRHPFAMVMGPDDSLWVTERRGFVMRVDPVTGNKTQLLNIVNNVRFTTSGGGTSISQDGMFGIALHPDLNKGTGNDYVYLAYCYDQSGSRRTKIVRYTYNRSVPSLTNEVTLLQGLPGSNDHNSGRLIIGNVGTSGSPDYKLFYTVGDQGANQFDNACNQIQSQNTPTAGQMSSGDYAQYAGKILRLNLDGSIPTDNPTFNGVKSHIYTIGHRNAQGLTFAKDTTGTLIPQGKLYNSEQGPAISDEVNLIIAGKNYGWPRVVGMKDDVWYKYYNWGGNGTCGSYSGECSSNQVNNGLLESTFTDPNYVDPIHDMYSRTPPPECAYLSNPTVAPSSAEFYYFNSKIPNWGNSILIPTLKESALLRVKLNDAPVTTSNTLALTILDANACTTSQIVDAVTTPVIDQTVDAAWAKAPVNSITKVVNGAIQSDFAGTSWRGMYDNTNLYLLVEVKDANLRNDSGTSWWEDDVVEVFIDGNNSKGSSYDGNNDFQYGFRWNDATIKTGGTNPANSANGISFAIQTVTGGYNLEVAIPWTTLNTTPSNGKAIGFDIEVDDDDNGGTREATVTAYANTNNAYNNPAAFGTVNLTVCGGSTPSAPAITSANTASGTANTAFSYTITATNTPTSFGATGLPAGLSVNTSTGVISGTPTSAGTSNATITATNAGGTGSQALTITIASGGSAPVITSANTATGTVNTAFSYTISASNTPTSYNATGLPAGLSVNTSTGVISGTPTSTGTTNATITATNASGTGSQALTITINPQAPVITSANTASGTVNTAFSYTITASNTPTSYNATGLPAGLSVNTSTGVISGTPTASGTSNATITATNAGGTGSQALTITITGTGSAPIISSINTANGLTGTAFSYAITASNAPTSYNATGLPTGLSINTTTGVISGTPSAAATTTVTISATNGTGTGSQTLTITIIAPPLPVCAATNIVDAASAPTIDQTVDAVWSKAVPHALTKVVNGSMPSDFSGTQWRAMYDNTKVYILVEVKDTNLRNDSGTNWWEDDVVELFFDGNNSKGSSYDGSNDYQYAFRWNDATLKTGGSNPANSATGITFAIQSVTGGYNLEAAIPWTTLNTTPSNGKAIGFDVEVDDDDNGGTRDATVTAFANTNNAYNNPSVFGTVNLTVCSSSSTAVAPVISSAATASGALSTSFSYTITASNTPTSYGATGLPAGLSINTSTGAITGTPTASGTFNTNISATNATGTGTKALAITITSPSAPVVSSAGTASGTVGTAFSYTITASNTPTSYGATGLPAGLSVNTSTGVISGTPTAAATSNVTISATNAGGTGTKALTITVSTDGQSAYPSGTPVNVPGIVQAENYDLGGQGIAYNDNDATNSGGQYRTSEGVDIETCSEGGFNVGWTNNNEWIEYTINVTQAGTYNIQSRVATPQTGKSFTIQLDGVNVATVNVPNTGGWQTWQTVSTSVSGITAGQKIMRIVMNNNDFNINYFDFTRTGNRPSEVLDVITSTGTVNVPYSYAITPNNASSYSATGLPAGLSINTTTGVISGTPTVTGTFNVTISSTNAAGTTVVGDTSRYFKNMSALNRYRDVALGKDGFTIYLLTDSVGSTSGPTSGTDGGLTDRGRILEYKYTGPGAPSQRQALPTFVRTNTARTVDLSIYPNPASKFLIIETGVKVIKPVNYNIYDITGKLLLQGNSQRDKFDVNINTLSKGVYLLKLYNKENVITTERFIVN